MAKLHSTLAFTGTLDSLSFYSRSDSDGIFVRRKGGPTKKMIKTKKQFDITRRINAEFGGRATAAKHIMNALRPLKPLGDYNIAGPLNAMLKPIQSLDTQNEYGQRSVCISENLKMLEGFDLNRKNPFDSIIRSPLEFTLSKEGLSAQVTVPALMPGFNFFAPPSRQPLYSFVISGGVIPDLFYTPQGYKPADGYENFRSEAAWSAWHPVVKGSPETVLQLDLKHEVMELPGSAFSMMLAIGICFGTVGEGQQPMPVKYAGAAKVLGMR